jgi:hypothetical protein
MSIETLDFLDRPVAGWKSQAQARGILVTRIGTIPAWEPTIGVHGIIGVLEMMMDSALAAALPGGLIEVVVDCLRGDRDWLRITIRDNAGGQAEKATLPKAAYRQAALLTGFIDITTYPGRQTSYSLYLPQDTLLRWLSYQSPSSRLYLISRRAETGSAASPGKPNKSSFEAGIAAASHRGQLRRLNETEYLYAWDGTRLPEASPAASLNIAKFKPDWAKLEPDWECHDLGTNLEFLRRVAELAEAEHSQPSATACQESPTTFPDPKPACVLMTDSLLRLESRDQAVEGEAARSSFAASWSAHSDGIHAVGSERALGTAAVLNTQKWSRRIRQRPRRVVSTASMRKHRYLDFVRPVISS